MYNLENPAYLEAKSLALCWEAYAKNTAGHEIEQIGFNNQSGYVYIALGNGITIASAFGKPIEFIIFDDEDQEVFLDDYETASNFAY
jgi:hypothetical protein